MLWHAGDTVTIRKLKYRNGALWTMWQWEETIWYAEDDFFIAIEPPGLTLTGEDKVWVAERYALFYFYPPLPFHFLEFYKNNAERTFDGWYCNINTVSQITSEGITWIDLDLDIWVNPDFTYKLLDEDEYQENSAQYAYPEELHTTIRQALDQLLERIRRREFPFRDHVTTYDASVRGLAARFGLEQTPNP
jgi:protein associated with RNAse G/E